MAENSWVSLGLNNKTLHIRAITPLVTARGPSLQEVCLLYILNVYIHIYII